MLPSASAVACRSLATSAIAATFAASTACMSLSPQLAPTDYRALAHIEDRSERERAYNENAIFRHETPAGPRFTKGNDPAATPRTWQSLDAVLRSDHNASAALPYRDLEIVRIFTALALLGVAGAVAGAAASAREGLDFSRMTARAGILFGGGMLAVGSVVTAGIFYGRARRGYARAVDVYNDSLGVRLGIVTGKGEYIPPKGVLVDEQGFIILDNKEADDSRSRAPSPSTPRQIPKEPVPSPAPVPSPVPSSVPSPPPLEQIPRPSTPLPHSPPPVQVPRPSTPSPHPSPPVQVPGPSAPPGGTDHTHGDAALSLLPAR